MSFLRLHVAAVLSVAALASGCAIDATEPSPASDGPVASTSQAVLIGGNTLSIGRILHPGDYMYSSNRQLYLIMQDDGNLVLYFSPFGTWTLPLWASGTNGNPGAWASFNGDGNLVVHSPNGNYVLWETGTSNGSPGYAVIQNDGNFVVYDINFNALWASNTNNLVPDDAHCHANFCAAGSWWHSCDSSDGPWCNLPACGFTTRSWCGYSIPNVIPSDGSSLISCSNNDGRLNCTSTTGTWDCQYVEEAGVPYKCQ